MTKQQNAPRVSYKGYHKKNERLKELGYRTYAEYLGSEDWKDIRKRVLEKQSVCLLCENKATQVHHYEYDFETLLGLKDYNLCGLCDRCHGKIEFSEDGVKRSLASARKELRRRSNDTKRARDWCRIIGNLKSRKRKKQKNRGRKRRRRR